MNHQTDIFLVDPHSKSRGSDHYPDFIVYEIILTGCFHPGFHLSVKSTGRKTVLPQARGNFGCRTGTGNINYSRTIMVFNDTP